MYEYIEQIKSLSYDNKYTKWYCEIVKVGLLRTGHLIRKQSRKKLATELLGEGNVECHHIVPRSIDASVVKELNNLVHLTLKEHYICHLLLPKMLKSTYHYSKMVFALNQLASKHGHGKNSKAYSANKKRYSEENSKKGKQYYIDNPEAKKIVKKTFKEAHERLGIDYSSSEWLDRSLHSEESRKKSKETLQSKEHRKKCSERELAKGKEKLSEIGRNRQKIQIEKAIEKYGSIEEYNKVRYADSLCKRKVKNLNTGEISTLRCRPSTLPDNYEIIPYTYKKKPQNTIDNFI